MMKIAFLNWQTPAAGTGQRFWRRLFTHDAGQDLIEYALLMAFMVIAVYVVLPSDLMPAIAGVYSRIINTANMLTGGS